MFDLVAVCGFGLESLARRELQELGYEATVDSPGHVRFSGDAEAVAQCNLWLRTVDRLVIQVGSQICEDFDSLFEFVGGANWEQWIGPLDSFLVTAHSVQSQLSSVPAVQRTVKKGIAQRLMAAHAVSDLPESGVQYSVNLGLVRNEARLTIDTTGPSLHRRGYRTRYLRGSLKETLAAAVIKLSFWDRSRPLLDPFCGSGTIPIEAAMIGCQIAPGRNRSFAAEKWPQVPAEIWEAVRRGADERQTDDLETRIVGMDVDRNALRLARLGAESMGVENSIHFQPASFDRAASKRKFGCVITNPPWHDPAYQTGLKRYELDDMIRSIPLVLRDFPTWSHFILSDHPDFEKLVGRSAAKKRKVYNDRTKCFLYQYAGPKPPSQQSEPHQQTALEMLAEQEGMEDSSPTGDEAGAIEIEAGAVEENMRQAPSAEPDLRGQNRGAQQLPAAFGVLTPKCHEQAELFRRRLVKRAKHLRRWPTRQGITCFRLYERDIPEIPLVVDRYEDHLHITEYERPHDRDPALHVSWLDLMAKTASETLEIPASNVFFKRRGRQKGEQQHQQLAEQKYEIQVQEGGLRFWVNLSDYVDTGLFLDHRETRSMVRDEVRGKRFVNLFAYTGAFTVYAADAPAASTVTVDWSNQYLNWAKRNMDLNNFSGPQHEFVRADAGSFIASLPEEPLFDVAVVDPPTFSNSKRTEQDWDVQVGYVKLLNDLLRRMDAGGIIYFSNNFRRFKFDGDAIQASVKHEISNQTVPPDFRNRRIHRCWRIVK